MQKFSQCVSAFNNVSYPQLRLDYREHIKFPVKNIPRKTFFCRAAPSGCFCISNLKIGFQSSEVATRGVLQKMFHLKFRKIYEKTLE